MKQLTGADEMWFSLESAKTPMHISDIHIYDPSTAPEGRVTREDVLNHIQQRLDKLCMREKRVPVPFGLDCSYWVEDEDFDLEYHVRHTKLPKPGTWRQLVAAAGRIIETPLDMSRPLWEIHIIEGLNKVKGFPKGCFAVVHKKHHGQFDGSSATYLKSVMHTLEADCSTEGACEPSSKPAEPEPTPFDLLLRTGLKGMMRPVERLNFFYRTLPNVGKALNAVVADNVKTGRAPRTRFSDAIPSPNRVMEARTVSMKDVQKLRKLVPGATVNDVVVTVFGGAVRKYLQHHNELPEKALLGLVPISVRKPEEIESGGNKVFSMITKMHTEVADPVERMAKVHEATQYSKEYTDAIGGRNMAEMLELAPLVMIDGAIKLASEMKLANYITAMDSGIAISNVPGSREPLYFCGARQLSCYNWGFLMDGMGLLLVAGSYCDELALTAVSCPEMMSDPEFFGECIQDAFEALKKA